MSVDNLIFSDNACCAFMAAIVKSYQEKVRDENYLGRTAMQKLVYLAKVLGVPIPCTFGLYTYGPYSDTVTFSVDSLMADDVLKDVSSSRAKYSNYRLGDNAEEMLSKYNSLLAPYYPKIENLVEVLGKYKPEQLELITTLHFSYERLKQIHRSEPTKAAVIHEFRRAKKDKFQKPTIESWYDALKAAQLV